MEVLLHLWNVLGLVGICYIFHNILQFVVTIIIIAKPNLSDKKVKYITEMFSSKWFPFRKNQ